MKIKAKEFILSLFYKPDNDQNRSELYSFKEKVSDATLKDDAIEAVIILFNSVREIQEKEVISSLIKEYEKVNYGQYDNLLKILNNIERNITFLNKINDVPQGELITASNVSLPNDKHETFLVSNTLFNTEDEKRVSSIAKRLIYERAFPVSKHIDNLFALV